MAAHFRLLRFTHSHFHPHWNILAAMRLLAARTCRMRFGYRQRGVIAGFYASNVSRFVFEEGTTVLKEDVGDLFYGPNQDTKVIDVVIPKSVTSIEVILDNHVLTGYRVIIHGYRGSAAEAFVQREAGNERFDVEFVPIECETHTWDGGVVTQEPTYDSEGVRTYTCTVCQATMTEVIPKLTNSEDRQILPIRKPGRAQPEETDPGRRDQDRSVRTGRNPGRWRKCGDRRKRIHRIGRRKQ